MGTFLFLEWGIFWEYADIAETVWYCMTFKKQQEADRAVNGVEVFLRYVDDIVRAVKGDPGVVLEATNKLHPNLQFTIEELDSNGNLAFLDQKSDSTIRTHFDAFAYICRLSGTSEARH